jgi:hypothetical protein
MLVFQRVATRAPDEIDACCHVRAILRHYAVCRCAARAGCSARSVFVSAALRFGRSVRPLDPRKPRRVPTAAHAPSALANELRALAA